MIDERKIRGHTVGKCESCELFAREAWPGNSVWGLEADKFDGESHADSPDDSALRTPDRHHDDADPQLSEEASRGTLL